MKIEVESFDDISESHREIEGYDHCIRVEFTEPFADPVEDSQYSPVLEHAMQKLFEREACVEVFGDLQPRDLLFDWRDEQELWLRYNLGASDPVFEDPSFERLEWLISVVVATELADFRTKELAEFLKAGWPEFQTIEQIVSELGENLISHDEDEFLVYIAYGQVVSFGDGTDALNWILRNIDIIERRFSIS